MCSKIFRSPPWPKGIDIQQYLCDKGGGYTRRLSSTNPCDIEAQCPQKMDLKCKVALVTGGAQGIGFATANELLKEGLHRVVIGDLDPCKGLKAAHTLNEEHGEDKCCFIPLNVACTKQLQEVMEKIRETYENIDIVVNNAGIVSTKVDLEIDTNYRPIVHGTKLALGLMKDQKRKNGAIVNIGCTKGISGCKHFPVYASEKSAVHVYSMSQARSEIDKKNKARILVLAPGMTDTEMGALFVDKPEPATNFQSPISVGKAVVFMLKFADSGTLYAIESRKLFKVTWPSKKSTYDFVACM